MARQTPSFDDTNPSLWSTLASHFHAYLTTYYLTAQSPSSHTQKAITNFSDPAITLWIASAILLGVTISLPQIVPPIRLLQPLLSNRFAKRLAIAFFLIPGVLITAHVLWMLDTIASIVIILWVGEIAPSTAGEVLQLGYYLVVTAGIITGWIWFVVWMYGQSMRVLMGVGVPGSRAEVEGLDGWKVHGLSEKGE